MQKTLNAKLTSEIVDIYLFKAIIETLGQCVKSIQS